MSIVREDPFVTIILASFIINIRHLFYGAAIKDDLSATGLKRLILAYFLVDESFLILSIIKKKMNYQRLSSKKIQLDDVLFGSGVGLWLTWNISTIFGFIVSRTLSFIISFPAEFILAATFLGYYIIQWYDSPSEYRFFTIMTLISFFLSFLFQSSMLIFVILLLGSIITATDQSDKNNQITTTRGQKDIVQ